MDTVWVDVHWVNYGPFGRLSRRQGVVVPLRQQRQAWTDKKSMMINRRYLLGLELEAERALAHLLINSLTILDAETGSPSDIDQNLVLIPELADAASRAGVTDMLAR